jgi:hypothetical protein
MVEYARLTYSRYRGRRKSEDGIADPNYQGEDEEHQRPEITRRCQLFASVLENLNELGEEPALKGIRRYLFHKQQLDVAH